MTTLEDQLRVQSDALMVEADAREQRRRDVRSVRHSSDMEGLLKSPEMDAMHEAYVNGTMTTADMKAQLDAKYRR